MKTAPVDIALQISALNEAVNQRLHLRVGWGEKIESHDMSVWGKTESKASLCYDVFSSQERQIQASLVLLQCRQWQFQTDKERPENRPYVSGCPGSLGKSHCVNWMSIQAFFTDPPLWLLSLTMQINTYDSPQRLFLNIPTPVDTRTDSLPASTPWVQAGSQAQALAHSPPSRVQTKLQNPSSRHSEAEAGIVPSCWHHFHDHTHAKPECSSFWKRSEQIHRLVLPAYGLLVKLRRKILEVPQQTIQIRRQTIPSWQGFWRARAQKTGWVQTPALPFISCVVLNKRLEVSELQFLLCKWVNSGSYLKNWRWEFSETMHVVYLAKYSLGAMHKGREHLPAPVKHTHASGEEPVHHSLLFFRRASLPSLVIIKVPSCRNKSKWRSELGRAGMRRCWLSRH